MINFALIQRIE